MERKEFYLNDVKYFIELYSENEIKIFSVNNDKQRHLFGKQKQIIIKKMAEIIENDKNNNFDEDVKSYVHDYIGGITREASKNTRYLGKKLFDYFRKNI
jgi:hypothetical protein